MASWRRPGEAEAGGPRLGEVLSTDSCCQLLHCCRCVKQKDVGEVLDWHWLTQKDRVGRGSMSLR